MKEQGMVKWYAFLLGIFILAFLLRGYALSDQPPLDDEVAAAFSADNYLRHGLLGQVMWYHPPLRNYVIAISGLLFGEYSAWGLRFGSVLFGSLSVPILGLLGSTLFHDRRIGALAALFLCLDPLHIAFSRQAFQESTTPFFILAGVLAVSRGIRSGNGGLYYLSGILFGLAAAAKWHGLFPLALSGMMVLVAPKKVRGTDPSFFPRMTKAFAAFVVLPAVVYIAVYIPWIMRGYGLGEFLDFQRWLVTYQYHHEALTYDQSMLPHRAYQWFLWPVGYADFVFHQGKAYLNIAMGNYLVWGLTLPSLGFALERLRKARPAGLLPAVLFFLVSYLPLVLTTRGIWVLSAPPVIPFAFLLSAYAIVALHDRGTISRRQITAYLGVAITLSLAMYPLATMQALDYEYLRPLTELYSPHGPEGH